MSQYEYEKSQEKFHKERRRQLNNEKNLEYERKKRQKSTPPVNDDEPLRQ